MSLFSVPPNVFSQIEELVECILEHLKKFLARVCTFTNFSKNVLEKSLKFCQEALFDQLLNLRKKHFGVRKESSLLFFRRQKTFPLNQCDLEKL